MKRIFLVFICCLIVNQLFSQFVKVTKIPIPFEDYSILNNIPVNFDSVHNPPRIYLSDPLSLYEFYINKIDSITITNYVYWELQDNTYLLYDSNMACIISLENLKRVRKIPNYKNIKEKIIKNSNKKEYFFRCTVKKIFIDYRTGHLTTTCYQSWYIKHELKPLKNIQIPSLEPMPSTNRIIFPNIICYEKDSVLGEYYHRKTKANKDTIFLFREFPLQLTNNIWYQYSDSSVLLLCLHDLKKQSSKPYKEHIAKISKGDITDKKADIFVGKYTFTFMNKDRRSSLSGIDELPKSIFFIRAKDE
jgi:hypothetical protein